MEIETADDRLITFFATEDFAVDCVLNGPGGYTTTIPVIMNTITDPATLFDTMIETPHANFSARFEDVAGVDEKKIKQYQATIEGTTYTLERLTRDQDGYIVTVYLKT
jgi:hypothetical protein